MVAMGQAAARRPPRLASWATRSFSATGTATAPGGGGVRRFCRAYNFTNGLVPYVQAWSWQQALTKQRMAWQKEQPPRVGHDALLLLEHSSVYTLGRGSTLKNLKFDPDDPACPHEVHRVERGGEVTWHGPGQVVAYPILDLTHHRKDLHWYLRQLEEVVIRTLAAHGMRGERDDDHTGVWVGGAKLAAIGLNASRWVTMHGLALNVHPDMARFRDIVPCGIEGRPVGCMRDLEPGVTANVVRGDLVRAFAEVFGVDVEVVPAQGEEDLDLSAGLSESAAAAPRAAVSAAS